MTRLRILGAVIALCIAGFFIGYVMQNDLVLWSTPILGITCIIAYLIRPGNGGGFSALWNATPKMGFLLLLYAGVTYAGLFETDIAFSFSQIEIQWSAVYALLGLVLLILERRADFRPAPVAQFNKYSSIALLVIAIGTMVIMPEYFLYSSMLTITAFIAGDVFMSWHLPKLVAPANAQPAGGGNNAQNASP